MTMVATMLTKRTRADADRCGSSVPPRSPWIPRVVVDPDLACDLHRHGLSDKIAQVTVAHRPGFERPSVEHEAVTQPAVSAGRLRSRWCDVVAAERDRPIGIVECRRRDVLDGDLDPVEVGGEPGRQGADRVGHDPFEPVGAACPEAIHRSAAAVAQGSAMTSVAVGHAPERSPDRARRRWLPDTC